MIKLVVQLCFVVGLSYVFVSYVMPLTMYMAVGAGVALCACIIFNVRYQEQRIRELPAVALDFLWSFIYALVLGALWPSLPLIIGIGATKRAAAERAARKESEPQ